MGQMTITKKPELNQLVLERTFDAPVARVFGAFTNAEALEKWWGPRGWETETKELTVEPGGRWHYGMKCIDKAQADWYGQTSWGLSIYESIDEPNGFVYIDYFCDEAGVVNESMPKTRSEMFFETVSEGTKLTSVVTCESPAAYDQLVNMGMLEGVSETWDRLEEFVEA